MAVPGTVEALVAIDGVAAVGVAVDAVVAIAVHGLADHGPTRLAAGGMTGAALLGQRRRGDGERQSRGNCAGSEKSQHFNLPGGQGFSGSTRACGPCSTTISGLHLPMQVGRGGHYFFTSSPSWAPSSVF